MAKIQVLSRHLVNKIAAGEVVERPASVVKELVENALDAGATAIDITVEDGGRRAVIVRDNGGGMERDDLALAFAPHATSKIAAEDDLFNIHTMGFRGEALASIAAISHASVVTRQKGSADPAAYEIRADGETVSDIRPTAAAEGTTVSVLDLFFNTPARRKFMKTAETEFGHVVEMLTRLALPRRDVSFSLTHNRRRTHTLAAGTLRQRAADLFGNELADGLIEYESREPGGRIFGLAGRPDQARASTRWQYFFVNGRYVRDRYLGHALRESYRGMLDLSRSPVAMVFIELPASEVDVNVHPTKIEVRFRNAQMLHSQVLGTLRETIRRSGPPVAAAGAATVGMTVGAPAAAPLGNTVGASPALNPELPTEAADDDRRQSLKQALADFFKSSPRPQPGLSFPAQPMTSYKGHAAPAVPAGDAVMRIPPAVTVDPVGAPTQRDDGNGEGAFSLVPAPVGDATAALQVHDSYLIQAVPGGIAIVDQHALHERLIYGELCRRLGEGNLVSQRLLLPQAITVTESDKALLAERTDLLNRLGIEVSEFGPRSVAVQRFPSLLAGREVPVEEFLRDLLDLLADQASADPAELLRLMLATMACKAAVKAGDRLEESEIAALLARRAEVEGPATCPHGRPTSIVLTLEELQKQFKRT